MTNVKGAAMLRRMLAALSTVAVPSSGVQAQSADTLFAAAQQEMVVTLEQAVDLARRSSPAMAQRMGAVRTAESSERVQFGSFLPSLSFNSGASLSSSERFDPDQLAAGDGSRFRAPLGRRA